LESMTVAGVRHFSLVFDGSPASLQKEEDRAKFKTVAKAQANLINRVYNHFKQKLGSFELSVLPGPDSRAAGDNSYLAELGAAIPPHVVLLWTGPEMVSRENTNEEAWELNALVGPRPLIWDNFPSKEDKSWLSYLGAKPRPAVSPNQGTAGFIATPMNL